MGLNLNPWMDKISGGMVIGGLFLVIRGGLLYYAYPKNILSQGKLQATKDLVIQKTRKNDLKVPRILVLWVLV